MTDDGRYRHPDYRTALDQSRPIAERRAAYARWADTFAIHWHPGTAGHSHAGGDRIHDHQSTGGTR